MKEKMTKKARYNLERQTQAEARKLHVLEMAERLFLEKGLANTTMNDIMEKANVSKATLYRYFDSINTIAFEVQYRMIRELSENADFMNDPTMAYEEQVYRLILKLIDEYHEHEEAHRYMGMFDNMYAKSYPSDDYLRDYNAFAKTMYMQMMEPNQEKRGEYVKLMTIINMVFSFLHRMALRGELLYKQQGISVDEQLSEFRKIIEKEFSS